MAILAPYARRPPQFRLRPPEEKRKVILNLLCTCTRLLQFYLMKMRTVAAALQLNAALRKPCPIRPHLDLYIAFPNLEEDTEMMTSPRGPRKGRPRLKIVKVYRISRHRTNAAPHRLALPAKPSPNPRRASGPPARVANFILFRLIAEPAARRTTGPRRLPRSGKMIGPKDSANNGICSLLSNTRAPPPPSHEFILRKPGI